MVLFCMLPPSASPLMLHRASGSFFQGPFGEQSRKMSPIAVKRYELACIALVRRLWLVNCPGLHVGIRGGTGTRD